MNLERLNRITVEEGKCRRRPCICKYATANEQIIIGKDEDCWGVPNVCAFNLRSRSVIRIVWADSAS